MGMAVPWNRQFALCAGAEGCRGDGETFRSIDLLGGLQRRDVTRHLLKLGGVAPRFAEGRRSRLSRCDLVGGDLYEASSRRRQPAEHRR